VHKHYLPTRGEKGFQKYCSECARRGTVRGRGLPVSKSLKTKAAKSASGIDLGSFVLAEIKAQ